MEPISILVVDDEEGYCNEISEFFSGNGYSVLTAERPGVALNLLSQHHADIAILDIRLPEMSGIELLKLIRKEYPLIEVIMITGHGDMESVIEALRNGAVDFFNKPFQLRDVMKRVEQVAKYIRIHRDIGGRIDEMSSCPGSLGMLPGSPIFGESRKMRQVLQMAGKVAASDRTTILITGESGTGKELIARSIHHGGSRKEGPFVAVNCSAVPEELFESEFFGFRKGAFTGAISETKGWFQAAHKGTLFMDEIGDLKLSLQSKLLRVLDQGKISRLGSREEIDVDVRLMAATNQDLKRLVSQGKFREDLYFRLQSFILNIPPLRERREDIPSLLNHYVQEYSRLTGKEISKVDHKVLDMLMKYDFPGNVRELKNMVERAVILSEYGHLLPVDFQTLEYLTRERRETGFPDSGTMDLDAIQRIYIQRALDTSGFNKTKAARMLNISRQALDRKIARLGLTDRPG
ncbi:MAG: sigma-54-dependent Fis family transcriptional regulator [Bacteroidales bacterium]|nr:sigma-54-dependent Fis family transcriptional regulator [Bacteroidales bacterium]